MKHNVRLYSLIGLSVLMVACGHSEKNQQAEAERISQEYQQKVEAEKKAQEQAEESSSTAFKLPPRPEDTPEPVGPPPNVDMMTDPDLVAKELISKDAKQRLAAIKRLGFLATQSKMPDSALQRLINTFNADEDKNVVDAAARALGQTCNPTAMLVLYNNLQRNVSDVNGQAIVELGDLAGFRAAEALDIFMAKLNDSNSAKITQLRTQAEAAKAKILSRNGSPVCAS